MLKGNATVTPYDMTGNLVMGKEFGVPAPGPHEIKIPANGINPGLYFVRVNIGNKISTQKLTLNK